jgi:hypothetical protein
MGRTSEGVEKATRSEMSERRHGFCIFVE